MLRRGRIALTLAPLTFVVVSSCTGLYSTVSTPDDASTDAPLDSPGTTSDGTKGNSADGTSSDSNESTEGDGAACTPIKPGNSALVTASIKLTGVNIGDSSTTAWVSLGFDIDDKCTTQTSTDVCTLASGAKSSVQDDGKSGIDNSFGENIVPIFDEAYKNFFTSGTFYISIEDGVGVMTYVGQDTSIAITVVNAKIDTVLQMFTAIVPTNELVSDMNAWFGRVSVELCSGTTHDSTDTTIRQASDILTDGTNISGVPCNGISLGLSYASFTNNSTAPSVGNDLCGD